VNERTVIVLGAVVGAVVGGVAGFLLLTERGRAAARELEPRVDELASDLAALQRTAARAAAAAQEGWRALNDVAARQQWSGADAPSAHGPF
jgi:gas vesicle protein